MLKSGSIVVIIVMLFVSPFIAQEKGDTTVIDLVEAIQKAESNNFVIKSEQYEKEAAEKNYKNQKTRELPNLSLLLFREDRFLSPYNFHQQGASLHSSWELGKLIVNNADVAKSESKIIENRIAQEKLTAGRRVAGIYLRILLAENEIKIQLKRLELMKKHKAIAQIGWRAGTRSKLDVLQSDNEITKIKEEIEKVKSKKEKLFTEFNLLVGNQRKYHLKSIDTEKIINLLLPDTSVLSVNGNPFITEYDFKTNTEILKKNAVASQQLPLIDFGGGFFNDADPTGDGNYWQVNIGLQLPLFMWGSTDYQRQVSDAKIKSLKLQQINMQRELNIFYRKTFNELGNYKTVAKIEKEREAIAEQAFSIAQIDYEAGLITNLEFIDAQQSLAEIKIKMKTTRLKYIAKLIDLYLAANRSDILFTMLKKF
jgi:outer membrane protein TolC